MIILIILIRTLKWWSLRASHDNKGRSKEGVSNNNLRKDNADDNDAKEHIGGHDDKRIIKLLAEMEAIGAIC